ncbi:MAG: tyrosine-protein phosphatase [Oscillospiraceae bacterium]
MTSNHPQSIGMTGIGNARELGGYPASDGRKVRSGILLRTARLSTATQEDIHRLQEVYHLAKIIDLRTEEEINGSPEIALFTGSIEPDLDPVLDGTEYIHLPVLDLKNQIHATEEFAMKPITDVFQMLAVSIDMGFVGDSLYIGFLDSEIGKQSYSRLFRELLSLEEGRSVLFHSTQGKDRTGLAAMLILSALGVSEEIIIADYMLTNLYNQKRIEAQRRMLENSGKIPPDKMELFMMVMDEVNESTMWSVMEYLKRQHGGILPYIVNILGISEQEIAQLKNKFLI